jgi:hypothetical protein
MTKGFHSGGLSPRPLSHESSALALDYRVLPRLGYLKPSEWTLGIGSRVRSVLISYKSTQCRLHKPNNQSIIMGPNYIIFTVFIS